MALIHFLALQIKFDVDQGSQTQGPRATCGPPDAFVRPLNILKTNRIMNLDNFSLYLRAFL